MKFCAYTEITYHSNKFIQVIHNCSSKLLLLWFVCTSFFATSWITFHHLQMQFLDSSHWDLIWKLNKCISPNKNKWHLNIIYIKWLKMGVFDHNLFTLKRQNINKQRWRILVITTMVVGWLVLKKLCTVRDQKQNGEWSYLEAHAQSNREVTPSI